MKKITTLLIATSLTIALSLAAQQQTPSSSDKSSSDKSSLDKSSSDKSTSDKSHQDEQKSKGGTESQTESTAGGQSSQTITSLQQLSTAASDPTSLQGKRVNLKDAKVGQVIGQDALTISSEEPGKEVLVKSMRPLESVKAGQTVTIMGLVRPMPADPSTLGLDQTASQKIQGQKFYIQARQIKASEQGQPGQPGQPGQQP